MFSAFKGPFEARIEEWNRKLCCVSDVLEVKKVFSYNMVASIESIHTYIQVWVTVQRNWLYLQPIFESPDINRQLPAEGTEISGLILNSF